jgi:amino-acid N-acetyltransferase
MTPEESARYIGWFRQSSPYINAHRGRTFVIGFGGESVAAPSFASLIHDLALLCSLGIRLVLVPGARPQVEARLRERGAEIRYVNGLRLTDAAALQCVKEAVGIVRVEIEALLSMGVANSPMAGYRMQVASGNFVTARPLGVRDGVDYEHTGEVRRIDGEAIRERLQQGDVVLVSPLGYSPTGEVFNLNAEEVAFAIARELQADKLLFLLDDAPLRDAAGELLRELTAQEAVEYLREHGQELPESLARLLHGGIEACRRGVRRVHFLDRRQDGALLLELFTRDGAGTLLTAQSFESVRRATIDDVVGILKLIQPLEEEGALVRRSRELLENEIEHFSVIERDSTIIACAALYPHADEAMGEVAAMAVHPDYRRSGRAELLLQRLEREARTAGLGRVFVLTAHTAHWFLERGFVAAPLEALPMARRDLYNYKRNSKVFIKDL